MNTYPMNSAPYQSFILPVVGITISLLWVESVGWVGGIENVVEGVRITPGLPVFQQYGYPNIYFLSSKDEIGFDDMNQTFLLIK